MPTQNIYYFSNKTCYLVNRNTGEEEDFILESPNGNGIYEIGIEGIFNDKYEDGDGSLRNSYNEYIIRLTFGYSSHLMDLFRLMGADEIIIPWSFGLKEFVEDRFVFLNEEAVRDYLHGLMLELEDETYWNGSVDLVFERVDPLRIYGLMELDMFGTPPDPDNPYY